MNDKLYKVIEVLNKWKGKEDALLHDGTQLICRTPQESPLGYLHKLYPPLNTLDIEKIEILLKVSLPFEYVDFLLSFNGMDLFNGNINIFGLRKSSNNTFNRFFQPLDIIIENIDNKIKNNILFAYYKKKYNVYFTSNDKKVIVNECGKETIYEYENLYSWLNHCINTLSTCFDKFGNQIKEI